MSTLTIPNSKLDSYFDLFIKNYSLNGFHSAMMHCGYSLLEAQKREWSIASSRLDLLCQYYREYLSEVTGRMDLDRLITIRSDFVIEFYKVARDLGLDVVTSDSILSLHTFIL